MTDAASFSSAPFGELVLDADATFPLSRAMTYLWRIDATLRQRFDIEAPQGRFAFFVHLWLNQEYYTGIPVPLVSQYAAYAHAPAADPAGTGVPITRLLAAIREARPDIRDAFDTLTPEGRLGLWGWLVDACPGLLEDPQCVAAVAAPVTAGGDACALPVPLAVLVARRHDVRALPDAGERERLLRWWLADGKAASPLLARVAEAWAARWSDGEHSELGLLCAMSRRLAEGAPLARLVPSPAAGRFAHATTPSGGNAPYGVSRFMRLLRLLREDVAARFDTALPEGRLAYWGWIVAQYPDAAGDAAFLEQASRPVMPLGAAPDASALPLGLYGVGRQHPDAQSFDPGQPQGLADLRRWGETVGERELPVLRALAARDRQHAIRTMPFLGDAALYASRRQRFAGDRRPGGLNIIGFASGELGVGEDARMAAAACQAAGIPYRVLDAPYAIPSRCEDSLLRGMLTASPHYAVNLFCMPIFEALRLFFQYGEELFCGRRNIGICPWELPHWPQPLRGALELFQEYWAPSTYIANAYAPATSSPVAHIPLAVDVSRCRQGSREDFGLPGDAFIFLFICDGLSWLQRKNPLAVVRAFRQAFPDAAAAGAHLVVKIMNGPERSPVFEALRGQAQRRDGITLLEATFDYPRLLGLYTCCDAYVSLHRAEGFGRTLAEAMLLGKPVITSRFSGNLDFCTDETAFLVNGRTVPLEASDYSFPDGQYWFDPDTDHAAALFRQVRSQPETVARTVARAREHLAAHNSPAGVGRLYRDRLIRLGVLAAGDGA